MSDYVVPEINAGPMTRRRLHELVWSVPVHRLAPHFRCTGTWIKKACVEAGIPTPHRGHWAKLAAGKRSAMRALPKGLDPDEVVLTLQAVGPAPPDPPLDADIKSAIDAIDARRSLPPAEAADIEHPLVVRTRRLAARGPDPQARDPYGKPLRDWIEVQAPLWIAATSERFDAALDLADAILHEIERAGFATAALTGGESPHSVTNVLGHEFILRVRERLTKRRHDPERDPPRDKWDVAYGRKEDVWEPNGHIEVEVRRPGDRYTRKRWSGGSRTSTGDRAVTIVRALVLEVQEARREAEAARIRDLEWEAESRRREIEETRRKYDRRQVELLEETINRWLRAETIWRFARAGRAAADAAGGANEREEAWLRWVEAEAKRNDPFGAGLDAVIRATTPGFARP